MLCENCMKNSVTLNKVLLGHRNAIMLTDGPWLLSGYIGEVE